MPSLQDSERFSCWLDYLSNRHPHERLDLLRLRDTRQVVNKSAGPFDALFCVGQFFPDSADQLDEFNDYIEGRAQIPLPTYFVGDYGVAATKVLLAATKDSGNRGFKLNGLKICNNLFWLKGSGKFKLHGLNLSPSPEPLSVNPPIETAPAPLSHRKSFTCNVPIPALQPNGSDLHPAAAMPSLMSPPVPQKIKGQVPFLSPSIPEVLPPDDAAPPPLSVEGHVPPVPPNNAPPP